MKIYIHAILDFLVLYTGSCLYCHLNKHDPLTTWSGVTSTILPFGHDSLTTTSNEGAFLQFIFWKSSRTVILA